MKRRIKTTIIAIISISFLSFFGLSIVLSWNPTEYSWADDPNRLNFPESVSNITLIVYYGEKNGTTDTFNANNMTNHYTTVFDFLNSSCNIEYRIYWQNNNAVFYVSSINSLAETDTGLGWRYTINDGFALGCNTISPPNNSIIRWFYSS